jgi:hypothetical protein
MDAFMKTSNFQKLFLVIVAVGLALSTMTVAAQNSPATAAPPLSYGVPQILQLAQAKVGDDTIIAYIRNSGNSYGLDANQIIYLRQQGVSDNVLTVMLTQPRPASAPAPTTPPPDNSYQAQAPASYAPAPTTTYVQSAPPSTVYVVPNSQPYYNNNYYYSQPYYYPYSYFPSVALSFAFGGSSYYHGGYYYGGYHGGGAYYHGGGYGGGYHGGGMMHH